MESSEGQWRAKGEQQRAEGDTGGQLRVTDSMEDQERAIE